MKKILIFLGATIVLAASIAACTGSNSQITSKEYVLTTEIKDGNLIFLGVSDEINGVANPTLNANPGETITVTLINGGMGQHDITFPEVKTSTGMVTAGQSPASSAPGSGDPQVIAAFQKGACGSCHIIPGIPNAAGVIAPDLSDVHLAALKHIDDGSYTGKAATAEEYIHESILEPNLFIAPKCPTGACMSNVMPATLKDSLSADEINSIVKYLDGLPAGAYGTGDAAVAAPVAAQAPATGVDVVRDPTDLPAPLEAREPTTVRIDLEAVEVEGQLADGTTFTYWTFNGAVPGPFFRVRLGDTIEVHMTNNTSSTMNHSVDFHAVTGPGGGAVMTQTQPGQESIFTAKALNVGLFVYHCATPMVAHHISNGMYGLILVEPEGGLPPVDREFYVMQGDIYTTGAFGEQGKQTTDVTKMLNEDPEYIVFNGAVGALTTQKPLKANVGETVRIFFGVGGPNLTSSFHVIGEIFDRVYDQASLTGAPLTDVQTTLVPPGGATMVEFDLEVPGNYILVDHALSRLQRGLAGYLIVEGPDAPEIFNGTPSPGSDH